MTWIGPPSGRFGVEGELLRATLLTALDIARGMAYLHTHNVIHGDLKPSNVLLCTDPCDPRGFIAKVRPSSYTYTWKAAEG